jgi:RNA polymerase sigma-70 factor (ECF subfamily)
MRDVRAGGILLANGMSKLSQAELQRLLMVHADRLHRLVRSKIPSEFKSVLTPDDIIQEVCVAAHRGRDSFRSEHPDSFKTWLNALVDRKLIDALKAARTLKRGGRSGTRIGNREHYESFAGLAEQVVSSQRSPSREVSAKEAVNAIRVALCGLPEDRRRALWMKHIEGKPVEEIAVIMQKSVPAVNSMLHRGMRQLRDQFNDAQKFFTDAGENPHP